MTVTSAGRVFLEVLEPVTEVVVCSEGTTSLTCLFPDGVEAVVIARRDLNAFWTDLIGRLN